MWGFLLISFVHEVLESCSELGRLTKKDLHRLVQDRGGEWALILTTSILPILAGIDILVMTYYL